MYYAFVCEDSSGAPTAPTGTPTGVLYKNGSATGTTVTVTMSTAVGIASAVVPSNAVQGDAFHIEITATISAVSYKSTGPVQTIWAASVPANVTQFGGTNGTFSGGRPEVNTTHVGGTSQTGRDLGASVLLSSGTGTGQISLSSGLVTLATSQTFNTTGSVGSVTGAVGSVTGSVGSVTGSVGSVAGSVGGSVASVAGDVSGKVLGGGSSAITGDGVRAASVTGAVGSVTGSVGSVVGTVTADASAIRAAVGLATNNLDTQLSGLFTTQMTESYAADGVTPTPAQALFLIMQNVGEVSIVDNIKTVKKLDGSTTAATYTLDSATDPTSSTRTT
jgi:hypothetical protein